MRNTKKKNVKANMPKNKATDDKKNIEEKPLAILRKLVSEDTEVITEGTILDRPILNNKEMIAFHIDGKDWYKGKTICEILNYTNTIKTLKRFIPTECKKSYEVISESFINPRKLDPKTIFIDNKGIFLLVAKSKKPNMIKLWKQITDDILPELYATGTYTLPPTEKKLLDKKSESNKKYDKIKSEYENKSIEHVEKYKNLELMYNLQKENNKDLKEHIKDLKEYNKTLKEYIKDLKNKKQIKT